jgi:putative hydrolase of the HAD superfamily
VNGAAVRAVVFDLGGVILESPLPAVHRIEGEHGLESGDLFGPFSDRHGAFARLMRGEIDTGAFDTAFATEAAAHGLQPIRGSAVLAAFEEMVVVRPEMLAAAGALRSAGYLTGVITNNWSKADTPDASLAGHFDVFVESWVEGLLKPDPAIYLVACERLGVSPPDVVFLDDFTENLEAASELGMGTILVRDPAKALRDLAVRLGPGFPGFTETAPDQ